MEVVMLASSLNSIVEIQFRVLLLNFLCVLFFNLNCFLVLLNRQISHKNTSSEK